MLALVISENNHKYIFLRACLLRVLNHKIILIKLK
jgi:hypothetical protein